jgi:hypothetical protein
VQIGRNAVDAYGVTRHMAEAGGLILLPTPSFLKHSALKALR